MILNESEFWTAVADYIEATGEMPPAYDGVPVTGLCGCVLNARNDGVINSATAHYATMRIRHILAQARRARRAYNDNGERGDAGPYLELKRAGAPRIKWARRFARESQS